MKRQPHVIILDDIDLPLAYISGKITGTPNLNKYKFAVAADLIRKIGYNPVNPHLLPDNHDKSWSSYMKECIKALIKCDFVFVLDDWKHSKGALREVFIASFLGLPIISIETMEPIKMTFLDKLRMILNLA